MSRAPNIRLQSMVANLTNIARHYYSLEEYFALEQSSNAQFEYWDGDIVCRSGGTPNKYRLITNVFGVFATKLKSKEWKVFSSCVPIYTSKTLPYRYADASIIYGDPSYTNFNGIYALENPVILVEVLSDTTEHADKNQKRIAYQAIKSLQEYILIEQNEVHVTHYVRQGDFWSIKDYREMQEVIELPSIGDTITVREIYANVKFED